jgi:predicted alpha/beta-hydrolase family hydrolase
LPTVGAKPELATATKERGDGGFADRRRKAGACDGDKGGTMNSIYAGPKRGADRAVLLAHGAGSDMHAATLGRVADALAVAKIPSLRFNYPYRDAGRKSPDRAAVLDATTREAAGELARQAKLPPERLVLGGRSMGGRYCSLIVGTDEDPVPALGLLLLGYPLHAAGKPDQPRVEHFPRITVPCLFASGTRDSLAGKAALTAAVKAIKGPVTMHWLESADHGYRPRKSSGRTTDDVAAEVAAASVDWVRSLPG